MILGNNWLLKEGALKLKHCYIPLLALFYQLSQHLRIFFNTLYLYFIEIILKIDLFLSCQFFFCAFVHKFGKMWHASLECQMIE